jgi:hypothetical protein
LWLAEWDQLKAEAAAGVRDVTAYDVELMLKRAIDASSMPPKMKGTMHFLVDTELYGKLGLNRSHKVLHAAK